MEQQPTLCHYVVITPAGDVFCSQVLAYDGDEALYKCANISSNAEIRKAQARQMEEDGWRVYSKFKWDYICAGKEP